MNAPIYYWDSSVFIAFFNDENAHGHADTVNQLLEEGKASRLSIITSSFSLVEVLRVGGHKPLSADDEIKIVEFFQYPFIHLVDATRIVCENARHLIWKHVGLHPKDAVHIASGLAYAHRSTLDGLFSYDDDFLKLNGIVTKKFAVTKPFMQQAVLPLTGGSVKATESLELEPPRQEV